MEPIEIPIDGVLDLHTFLPKELPDLLSDYLALCREKGILRVRIIHGKGTGVQKARVRSLLAKNALVRTFKDAPEQEGGWGATIAELYA
ncbi:MAG: DNA mismatch repair protein MutS [Desulfobacteraceae bacterium]|nr:MAG: DNA mismatch repair protein MutS [Desulfobacteraceae bacterium]